MSFAWQLFGAPESIQAAATFKETGADAELATILRYPGGQIATSYVATTTAGPNTATLLGTRGRIEIDSVWYAPSTLRVYDSAHRLLETFHGQTTGRGMQFQAAEAERLVHAGQNSSDIMPIEQSVQIMDTLDAIRMQLGLWYPDDPPHQI